VIGQWAGLYLDGCDTD